MIEVEEISIVKILQTMKPGRKLFAPIKTPPAHIFPASNETPVTQRASGLLAAWAFHSLCPLTMKGSVKKP